MGMHYVARGLWPALAVFVAACTEPAGGGGGIDGESHVVHLDIAVVGGSPCVDVSLLDVDSSIPGPQYECAVSFVRNPGMPNQTETILPACNNGSTPASSTNKPCWSVQEDAATCPTSPSLALIVEVNEQPSSDTHVVADCVSEP